MVARLSRSDAERRLRKCLESGAVRPSRHCLDELLADGMDYADAEWVLERGTVYGEAEPDIKTGEWKYRIEGRTPDGDWVCVVFCFKSDSLAVLITAWASRAG